MTEFARAERQPYAVRRSIDKLKEEIPIEDYLRTQGVEVKRNRSRCIVHGGDNPQSFRIIPETKKWRCHACGGWGNVVDLCKLVEGHDETWTAVVSLSLSFQVDLPKRPERWHKRQDEKAKVREAAKRHIAGVYQHWFTRLYAPLVLLGGQTPEEELAELEGLAAALWPISLDWAERRVNGE